MINENMVDFKQEIIDTIEKRIAEGAKEIFIEMVAGTGRGTVIKRLIERFDDEDRILILTDTRILELQYIERFRKYENVEVKYYRDLVSRDDYKYVIFSEVSRVTNEDYQRMIENFNQAKFIFFCDIPQGMKRYDWLNTKKKDYSLNLERMLEYGYINSFGNLFNDFVAKMLEKLKTVKIIEEYDLRIENKLSRLDFVIDCSGKKILLECKSYRNEFVQTPIINQSVKQILDFRDAWLKYNGEEVEAVLIVSCQVTDELKEKYYQEKNALIIDIANLLYLIQGDNELVNDLIEAVQYNISHIIPKPLLLSKISLFNNLFQIKDIENKELEDGDISKNLIERLENIEPGNEAGQASEYEKLCVEIIKYLFESEFTKMVEQSSTRDRMFKMDLICGLKGTSEFWNIFIKHYNTRFVVFEFKNYEDQIDQNLIYVTEKYLYDAVLRNVAIVISRKGFSENALKAATGILTESGKLMIDISDNDIITMLNMKADGQDASDYMLNLLEDYLMSISK